MSLAEIISRYGLPALFLGAGLEGETVVVLGGIAAHKGLVSLPGAMAATAIGSCVVDQIYFLIGRKVTGWPIVKRLKGNALYGRAMTMVERYPIGFTFAFRFIYGFRTISPFAIGTSQVPALTFSIVNAVAAVIWGCAFTAIGYVFGHTAEKLLDRLQPSPLTIAIVVAVGVALAVAAHFAIKRWSAGKSDE